jgi:ABC-2 type transport system ATP-binding protein
VIVAKGLSKWYGQVIGLNDVNVEIGPGVTGLLGPNGAGKTTFLRLMSGQLRPSQGSLTVLGGTPWNNPEVLRRIGFCPDEDAFYELSGLQFVATLARISGLPRGEAKDRAAQVLEQVGMKEHMHRLVTGYSKGMRQRTKLAQAIVHDPDVIFLDEPLTGADPVGRRDLRDLIAGLAGAGKQVVLSSHVLHEVESLTQTIVLVHRGRIVAEGQVGEIRALMNQHPHRVVVRCDKPRELAQRLVVLPHVVGVELQDAGLIAQTRQAAEFFAELPDILLELETQVEELFSEDDDLNAVFRYLVER